jgi:hypothetical protein
MRGNPGFPLIGGRFARACSVTLIGVSVSPDVTHACSGDIGLPSKRHVLQGGPVLAWVHLVGLIRSLSAPA